MSRNKDTVSGLITFFNALLEEGVYKVSTYAERLGAATPGAFEQQTRPVKCGLITTMAKDVLLDGRHHWSRVGFMSRLLPISYEYTFSTQSEIHQSIARREYLKMEPISLTLPEKDTKVDLSTELAERLTILTVFVTSSTRKDSPENVYGFRLHKHLQTLAMASALREGRDMVTTTDLDLLKDLAVCINLQYYPV